MQNKFEDVYRKLNPQTKEFTWSNNETATRIDQIWLSEGLLKMVTCAEIQELLVITSSNHELPVARLRLKEIHSEKESDPNTQSACSTTRWKLNLMISEKWEEYQIVLW